jgi:hypothetical protein
MKEEKKQKGSGDKRSKKISKIGGGFEKLKNKEKKPKWWGRKKKIKRGVFTKWQLNLFTLVEFV